MREFDVQYWLGLGWLTGPIFGKELRVSSRRRRHYVIRSLYVSLLVVIMSFVWVGAMRYDQMSAYQSGELAEVGRIVTMLVTWSQFLLCQVVAGVMLSTAISDEIYNKTLGVLMTTPISGLQIVAGKLLSKLLQCILLVGVSLPILATVRVFGGIPWAYVLSSVCITLSMSVWVGSLSLFFSISQRKAYVVIIQTIVALGMLFALIPFLVFWFLDQFLRIQEQKWLPLFLISNPYAMMAFATQWLMSPRAMTSSVVKYWPWHCAILLAGSGLLLSWCTVRVRKVALRQIAGNTDAVKLPSHKTMRATQGRRSWLLRHMGNWPVLWKDLRTPVLGGKTRFRRILNWCIIAGTLILVYVAIGVEGGFSQRDMHAVMSCLYTILAALLTIVITATPITSEKEARSWPILLGTAQTDWRILASKWLAMFRWSLPVWGLLFGHLAVFTLCGFIHPAVLILMLPVALGVINLLLGTGLYWSARMRRTTTAVVCNFTVPLMLWAVIPVVWVMMVEISRMSDNGLEVYMSWNPFFQAGSVVDGCARRGGLLKFYLIGGTQNVWETLQLVWQGCCVYSVIGFGFAWRAMQLFRRRIF
ncbi:MAG: ABC transporter permease [Phycisphaerae bacterium]|nr:ABC transporter permease [Phycisphaerae bacterium]